MHVFINEIRIPWKEEGHQSSYATSTIRKFITGNGRGGKKELNVVILSKYSERLYLSQNRAWKERYHQNMFDAIVLGLMALSLIENKF